MNKEEAIEFLHHVKAAQSALEQAANYLLNLEPTAAHQALRRQITEVIGLTITEVEFPVIHQYPELNPYR
ncbi:MULTISPECIES: hypothetical protein [unclassified Pseudomonas]|uniref:hypothetical protein n=1 Tax=unclassified Pseudomonas TaxID=196821 RepID=UPI002449C9AA|nr:MULTISPECIES: hypothetical protein [unclassified Pseudomonas]MDG9922600.1 hypothetical protein [Pseudomonas sp. GD04045]MDH0033267.1 hypothetical protein [Pseudomonas sp. GD04019]